MASNFGKVEEFSSENDWTEYTERLEQYFLANDVVDGAKKRAILLSSVGSKTYGLLRSLVAPKKPADKSFDDLVKTMKDHQNPKPSEIVQRFKFHTCVRKSNQTVGVFVAELRRLSEHCNFGDKLEDALRDRIVCGIQDERIQRRLLAETTLTFTKALEIAQSMETAAKNTADLQGSVPTLSENSSVNKVTEEKKAECYRCKGNHMPHKCRFKKAQCYNCGEKGHIAGACPNKSQQGKVHNLDEHSEDSVSQTYEEYQIFYVELDRPRPYKWTMSVEGKDLVMEVDSGASLSVISEKTFEQTFGDSLQIEKTNIVLKTYTKQAIPIVGVASVTVRFEGETLSLPLVVIKGDGPCLLGRSWLNKFKRFQEVFSIEADTAVETILTKYPHVFEDGLGLVNGVKEHIHLKTDAKPRFYRPRSIPYAMKERVDKELDRLIEEQIIEPVQYADWAAPIVPVLKANKVDVRICGDYRVTVNRETKLDSYPLPSIDDLYANIAGGKVFSKIDLSNAYLQIPLDEESKPLTTINTHRGLFQYNRLPFGIASSPGIFQRVIESIMKGVPKICIYLDDILIAAKDNTEHNQVLELVLGRLSEAGFRLKFEKCSFSQSEVVYLGYKIDKDGLHPVEDRVKAIRLARAPKNVSELKSYLGLINYYARFMPNLATLLAPLHELLKKHTRFFWGKRQQSAFQSSKELLQSSNVLVHYDLEKEIILCCDASPYGLGAILAHVMPNGEEHPICYASRSLAPAEKNYSQLEKEGLSCVWAVKKFHKYLFGREFTIYNDHKPLQTLFSESKPISPMAAARIQRWSLTLSAYKYKFVYRPGNKMTNADALSRLPLPDRPQGVPRVPETIFLLECLDSSRVTSQQIGDWTRKDPILSKVLRHVNHGWPEVCGEALKPFYTRRSELSTENGCVLWGSRVVVPPRGREFVLELLHEAHPGIVKMKSLARSYVWWPGIDQALEGKVQSCSACQAHQKSPPVAHLNSWGYPERPWSRIHVDYAGPVDGKMILIVVDAYTKWIEAHVMTSSTSEATVARLRMTFSQFGLPDIVVSDNGTCFTGRPFQEFMKANGIRHVTSAPFHPATNGQAERAVQIIKTGIKKMSGDLTLRIARVLFRYRVTPHSTTGRSPSELMFGRTLKTHFDLLHPQNTLVTKVQDSIAQQKENHDTHARCRVFDIDDFVSVQNFGPGA